VTKTLPGHPDSSAGNGRIVTLEFEKCFIVGTYVVNAGEKLKVRHPAFPESDLSSRPVHV
jgi:exonuclease III